MALLTSNPPRIEHTGDGVTRTFTYNFRILAATDLEVYVAGVLKTHVTDYSVGNVDNANGGDVTFTVAATPANLAKILFIRATPATQEVVYPVGSKFPSTTHERVADKLTMLSQQRDEEIGRALKFPVTSTQKDKTVDDLVALKHLRVKADASGIDMVDAPTGTVSFPITTAQGGMGADVSVSAAEGDLLVRNAGLVFARLAKAAQGAILRAGASTLNWLAKGNDGELLEAGASDIAWITRAAMFFKTLTTKGDLLVSTGATAQRKAVGSNGQVLTADSAQGDGLRWATPEAGFNYTFNGDFEIWGSGAAAAPTGWDAGGGGVSVAKDTTNKKVSLASAAVTRNGTDVSLTQNIHTIFHGIAWWKGRTVTFGAWVRATVANRARVVIADGVDQVESAYHSGGGAFEFLTITRTIDAGSASVAVGLLIDVGDTTAQIDGAILVIGSYVSDFIPSGWRGRTSFMPFTSGANQAQGQTIFYGVGHQNTTEVSARFQVPFKCVLRRMHCATDVAVGGAGQTAIFTMRKDAADTALTATISSGANVAQDNTNEVSYNANQSLVLKVVTSATTGTLIISGVVVVEEIP